MEELITLIIFFFIIYYTFRIIIRKFGLFVYRNPHYRICVKCGAHQNRYCWSWDLSLPGAGWWEEVYPIGNDPKCKCHKKAEE